MATAAAGRHHGGPTLTETKANPPEELWVTAWCDGPSEEVCGQLRRPESHEETTATATLEQIEIAQVKLTENRKPLLLV